MNNASAVPADLATMSLDSILESSVDNLMDMKEFKPLPVGRYKMLFDWEPSEDPIGIRFNFTITEVLELANPQEAEEVEAGQKWAHTNFWFTKDGEPSSMGQGQVKQFLQLFEPVFGGGPAMSGILDAASGCEMVITTNQRRNRQDREIIYDGIKSAELFDPEVHG